MAIITPTITTADPHEYREQMSLIKSYAEGVHIDFSGGVFTPNALLPIQDAWRDDKLITHVHIMCHDALEVIEDVISLEADLVILHIESTNAVEALERLYENGTRAGIALLAESSVADIEELDADGLFDHVLIFGGHLGFQGGKADLSQLHKVQEVKEVYPEVEIGWDGGVNETNAKEIANAGVDVLNVGGYLKNAPDPKKAYATLTSLIS
jgi:ribulose-phosphate 3-epimerase